MLSKPFRTPFLKKQSESVENGAHNGSQPPPAKKRRTSVEPTSEADMIDLTQSMPPQFRPSQPRKSFQNVNKSLFVSSPSTPTTNVGSVEGYYNVLWRKVTTKKHKTWDGDGVLRVSSGYATLQDITDGREMGRSMCKTLPDLGAIISVGGKEVEIVSTISKEDFMAGRPFLGTQSKPTVRELDQELQVGLRFNSKSKSQVIREEEDKADTELSQRLLLANPATTARFRTPVMAGTVVPKFKTNEPVPRHNPAQEGALVMKRPNSVPAGKQIVDVVVDPIIGSQLREHQREGVKFMYECVMGMRSSGYEGAILADEMGLGKTLQVITLLWTLLKQNPIHEAPPIIKKALIVCPVSVMKNWRKEIRKWLGNERIGVLLMDKDTRVRDFTHGKSYSILIVGYEKLRTVYEELQKGDGVDIVIADEGHRLKTAKNKSAEAIKALGTDKRIILSGTPLQNDLGEFFFTVDLVNPGLLGRMSAFKREFETPINKGRQPDASAKDIEKSNARNEELIKLTGTFVLRRTADILAKYLPAKTEYVLFCKPTEAQASVYRKVIESTAFGAVLGSSEATLQLITILKKLCNSPSLLKAKEDASEGNKAIASLMADIPPRLLKTPGASGKLQVLDSLLYRIRTTTSEKVVLISHYTSTLDILGNLLDSLQYPWLRLDGSTPSSKRQDLIDKFNRTDASTCFAFLLSNKSGGTGLNLVGASRLILYDIDWNPSNDLQAMARIHRDGQKLPCKIYRLITQGAIDEKIYQRQLTKLSLSDSIIDNKASTAGFSREELRDLFTLDESGRCQTHELLGCPCNGRGAPVVVPATLATLAESTTPIDISDDDNDSDSDSDDDLLSIEDFATKLAPPHPMKPMLIPASQFDAAAAERDEEAATAVANAARSSMATLMSFHHVNTSASGLPTGDDVQAQVQASAEAQKLVEDAVLQGVLGEDGCRVSFLFSKTVS